MFCTCEQSVRIAASVARLPNHTSTFSCFVPSSSPFGAAPVAAQQQHFQQWAPQAHPGGYGYPAQAAMWQQQAFAQQQYAAQQQQQQTLSAQQAQQAQGPGEGGNRFAALGALPRRDPRAGK
jgi:hypothetical protein